jgi:hypothetical protein
MKVINKPFLVVLAGLFLAVVCFSTYKQIENKFVLIVMESGK